MGDLMLTFDQLDDDSRLDAAIISLRTEKNGLEQK